MNQIIMNTAPTDTGYCCTCELLPGWVVTGSSDFDQFKKEVADSVAFYLECAQKDGERYPDVFDRPFEIVYKFNVQALLDYYRGIFSFAALEHITGINQKQLAHYASGRSKPRKRQAEKISAGLHRLAHELMTVTV